MESLVRLEEVRVHFAVRKMLFRTATVAAVEDVSLEIMPGETLALVGESGSGKTTLGRAALRLLPVTGGRILFDGHDITHTPDSRLKWFRRRAQAVFQDPYSSIDPFMSVLQVLEEPMVIHGVDDQKDRIESALRDVRLTPPEEYVPKYPHMLSGGQRQRVSLMRALVLNPDVLLLDEPLGALDPMVRASLQTDLKAIFRSLGKTVVLVTHDMAEAAYLGDQIVVLKEGRIVQEGTLDDLRERPSDGFISEFISAQRSLVQL